MRTAVLTYRDKYGSYPVEALFQGRDERDARTRAWRWVKANTAENVPFKIVCREPT